MMLIAAATTQPDPQWAAKVAVGLLAVIAILLVLDRLGLWMEKRGWIYWRRTKREAGTGGGGTAGILTEFQKLVEPQTEHRIQVMEERRDQAEERKGRGNDVERKP